MKVISLIAALMSILSACQNSSSQTDQSHLASSNEVAKCDTLISASNKEIDSAALIILKMNRDAAYISMADSIIPSENDSTIALCVEAAFTGELLKDFKSTNIGGDYVIEGVFHKGYKCRANTGFLYADCNTFTISSSDQCRQWIEKAKKNGGSLFQQIMIIRNGKDVYRGSPIKPASRNIYRAACILNDGNFAVIQSVEAMPLKDFIASLIQYGVSDALYLDMGRGWNYGWYRETADSPVIQLFNERTPFQTNWLIIRTKTPAGAKANEQK